MSDRRRSKFLTLFKRFGWSLIDSCIHLAGFEAGMAGVRAKPKRESCRKAGARANDLILSLIHI
eukprot:3983905-Amphidinium_carterae.5